MNRKPKKNKKIYLEPDADIIVFGCRDILSTSGDDKDLSDDWAEEDENF